MQCCQLIIIHMRLSYLIGGAPRNQCTKTVFYTPCSGRKKYNLIWGNLTFITWILWARVVMGPRRNGAASCGLNVISCFGLTLFIKTFNGSYVGSMLWRNLLTAQHFGKLK